MGITNKLKSQQKSPGFFGRGEVIAESYIETWTCDICGHSEDTWAHQGQYTGYARGSIKELIEAKTGKYFDRGAIVCKKHSDKEIKKLEKKLSMGGEIK